MGNSLDIHIYAVCFGTCVYYVTLYVIFTWSFSTSSNLDGVCKGVDRLHVQVVGWLVQQQDVRLLQRQRRKHHTRLIDGCV